MEYYPIISTAYAGFPRGRIQKVGRKFKVYHGSDFEKLVSRQSILDQFGIDSDQAVWEFDDHERVLTFDKETIKKVFNIKEDWRSVDI